MRFSNLIIFFPLSISKKKYFEDKRQIWRGRKKIICGEGEKGGTKIRGYLGS